MALLRKQSRTVSRNKFGINYGNKNSIVLRLHNHNKTTINKQKARAATLRQAQGETCAAVSSQFTEISSKQAAILVPPPNNLIKSIKKAASKLLL